ncbi:PREDICTED: nascent polypeptide-associated complex subunit alpha, muscle-specific form-like [Chinchilla lanigera]|uniref:nascent polypeptide-associated complex subunit alpha, muscle-specific form-like n=1 Tax=Chinchilla lanigera TaxID=34839 RepID=UPI0006989AC6|nr:PREDICTED: nascent polypeptide-associated complex subunit alpha, muscle-specific form-like [Chinchilla lanigera]
MGWLLRGGDSHAQRDPLPQGPTPPSCQGRSHVAPHAGRLLLSLEATCPSLRSAPPAPGRRPKLSPGPQPEPPEEREAERALFALLCRGCELPRLPSFPRRPACLLRPLLPTAALLLSPQESCPGSCVPAFPRLRVSRKPRTWCGVPVRMVPEASPYALRGPCRSPEAWAEPHATSCEAPLGFLPTPRDQIGFLSPAELREVTQKMLLNPDSPGRCDSLWSLTPSPASASPPQAVRPPTPVLCERLPAPATPPPEVSQGSPWGSGRRTPRSAPGPGPRGRSHRRLSGCELTAAEGTAGLPPSLECEPGCAAPNCDPQPHS